MPNVSSSGNNQQIDMPDAEIENFTPNHTVSDKENNSANRFENIELNHLLCYEVDLMQDQILFPYAFALKYKILKKIFEFKDPEKNELEFLCAITDGSQTEKNQKLITVRMCNIVKRTITETENMQNLQNNCKNHPTQVSEATHDSDLVLKSSRENLPEDDENVPSDKTLHCEIENNENSESSIFEEINSYTNDTSDNESYIESLFENNFKSNAPATKLKHNIATSSEDNTYDSFKLEDLLNYDAEVMSGSTLVSYALALRKKVLEKIFLFPHPDKEKLEFLCELTDGTQTAVNQKLITTRMCNIIHSFIQKVKIFSRHNKYANSSKPKRSYRRWN